MYASIRNDRNSLGDLGCGPPALGLGRSRAKGLFTAFLNVHTVPPSRPSSLGPRNLARVRVATATRRVTARRARRVPGASTAPGAHGSWRTKLLAAHKSTVGLWICVYQGFLQRPVLPNNSQRTPRKPWGKPCLQLSICRSHCTSALIPKPFSRWLVRRSQTSVLHELFHPCQVVLKILFIPEQSHPDHRLVCSSVIESIPSFFFFHFCCCCLRQGLTTEFRLALNSLCTPSWP
ncbi:uncharacterized protein LOC110347184 [Heterocephalus glaber]|uniref:Uncharacterized protein LOC110347184 n=1 Tax=Heterocephalus glaber TaxID=10181 RepID=A0AAX6SAC1_HETGA|nr:uncharacterized protein LOC110347184 [Heterocephalus glaber]